MGVLTPTGVQPAEAPTTEVQSLREILLALADAKQLIPFNLNASLQKQMFTDGFVPNSTEFELKLASARFTAQRAENLLTGEVRVYYAATANLSLVRFVVRGGTGALVTPFEGGNRITQKFGMRPEFYGKYGLKGHEGIDLVPKDGDRDILCIEDGVILKDVDVEGDPKTNAYGIYVVVYNRANRRMWYYCHMIENTVFKDQEVTRGERVGRMGGTGNTQGDHLHLGLKPLNNVGVPLEPNNGYKGWVDPLPVMEELNASVPSTPLRDALLTMAESVQTIAFNTQAALQKRMFADALCPNSPEFEVAHDDIHYIAQRAENLETGQVRVYFAPTADFNDIQFFER